MSAAVVGALVPSGAALINAKTQSNASANAVAATQATSDKAIALQTQMYNDQKAIDDAARARRLAVAGNNRQIIMGADGKMTAGPLQSSLGGYGGTTATAPTSQVLSNSGVEQSGTPLSNYGGGNKVNTDAQDTGMSSPGSAMTSSMSNPTFVYVSNPATGESRRVPMDQIPSGWVVLNQSVSNARA